MHARASNPLFAPTLDFEQSLAEAARRYDGERQGGSLVQFMKNMKEMDKESGRVLTRHRNPENDEI
jgi:hypothetical protein